MHQFNEHHPELKGFSEFYQYAILPTLLAQENNRLSRLKDMRRVGFVVITLALIALGLSFIFNAPPVAYIIIVLIGAFLATAAGTTRLGHIKFNTKTKILDEICGFLGCSYQRTIAISAHIETCKELGLLTSNYDFERLSDHVAGRAYDQAFEFFYFRLEKRLENKMLGQSPTRFQGRLFILDINRNSPAKTIVLRDKGVFNSNALMGLKRVGFADPVFERLFEAYSSDQVEARYMLTPDFMQRLIDLETVVDGRNIRFCFAGNKLLIVIQTENIFDAGDMTKPVTETSRTQRILDEFGAIYDVVDAIAKPMRL